MSSNNKSDGFIRQRRNLLLISFFMLFYTTNQLDITELNLLGTVVKITDSNDLLILIFIFILFIYFLLRYIEFFSEDDSRKENHQKFIKSYKEHFNLFFTSYVHDQLTGKVFFEFADNKHTQLPRPIIGDKPGCHIPRSNPLGFVKDKYIFPLYFEKTIIIHKNAANESQLKSASKLDTLYDELNECYFSTFKYNYFSYIWQFVKFGSNFLIFKFYISEYIFPLFFAFFSLFSSIYILFIHS